jgi:hypothetical protein
LIKLQRVPKTFVNHNELTFPSSLYRRSRGRQQSIMSRYILVSQKIFDRGDESFLLARHRGKASKLALTEGLTQAVVHRNRRVRVAAQDPNRKYTTAELSLRLQRQKNCEETGEGFVHFANLAK